MRVVFFLVSDKLTRIIVKEVIDIKHICFNHKKTTTFNYIVSIWVSSGIVSVDLLQFYIPVLLVLFCSLSISISRVRKMISTRRTHTQAINKNCTIEWLIALNLKQYATITSHNSQPANNRKKSQTNKQTWTAVAITEKSLNLQTKPMSDSIEIIYTKRFAECTKTMCAAAESFRFASMYVSFERIECWAFA